MAAVGAHRVVDHLNVHAVRERHQEDSEGQPHGDGAHRDQRAPQVAPHTTPGDANEIEHDYT